MARYFLRLLPALVGLAVLGASRVKGAQSVSSPSPAPSTGVVPTDDAPPAEPYWIEGRVVTEDNAPAAGAIVTSSAGGQAVTDADGRFRFEDAVPVAAAYVELSATHGSGSARTEAVAEVPIERALLRPPVARLKLQRPSCQYGWVPTFGEQPGPMFATLASDSPLVSALEVFDGGSGSKLYVAGDFDFAGRAAANNIATWDGERWSRLASGTNRAAHAFAVFDDGLGGGPELYVGGDFSVAGFIGTNGIAKWNGARWARVGSGVNNGMNGSVYALCVYDDGSGPALYAAGAFTTVEGTAASSIAKWDGTHWTTLGSGVSGGVNFPRIDCLRVFDDGNGPALYAGGVFTLAGGVSANRIAKWDGSSWAALGAGVASSSFFTPRVRALEVFDDGGGPALYAGGDFTSAGGVQVQSIAKWDGTSWSPLPFGNSGGSVYSLRSVGGSGGAGPLLLVGSQVDHLEGWTGSNWVPFGNGLDSSVLAMAEFDDGHGGGATLHVGGTFRVAGGLAVGHIAKWAGAWAPLGEGLGGFVGTLTTFGDESGAGPALFVGGLFDSAGTVRASNIARWDGTSWSSLGAGIPSSFQQCSQVFDLGQGPELIVGPFRWNGTTWSSLDLASLNGHMFSLLVFDDGSGPALYAGGEFTQGFPPQSVGVMKWDGTHWQPVGSNPPIGRALAVWDDGSGPALYAGSQSELARWDGTSWTFYGAHITGGGVCSMAVYDDGGGPKLYVGGGFPTVGGATMNNIARWDGTGWSPLGAGTNDIVRALTVYDDGRGPVLVASGNFTSAGGVAANRIAKWDGTSWAPFGRGAAAGVIDALLAHGSMLYAGGSFPAAADSGDSNLARWLGCDTIAPVITCPGTVVKPDRPASPPGEIVSFSVTATDESDLFPRLVCVPPSGSFFPRGTTHVNCFATDAAGNESTCAFDVIVESVVPLVRRR